MRRKWYWLVELAGPKEKPWILLKSGKSKQALMGEAKKYPTDKPIAIAELVVIWPV